MKPDLARCFEQTTRPLLCLFPATTMILETTAQFDRWLAENGWFDHGRVLSLQPPPKPGEAPPPSTVTLDLAYPIQGDYKAHSTRVSRVFHLVATGIHAYHLPEGACYNPEHWSEGIETLDCDSPIAFQIDVPALLTLCCSTITVKELANLVETVKPWLSDREVFAMIPSGTIPTPAQWVAFFERQGLGVAWHVYGDRSREVSEVPTADYEGWFLQIPDLLDHAHQGIFFFACKPDGDGFRVSIHNHNASGSLWHAAMIVLGQFSDVEVRCGNCEFKRPEWLEELRRRDQAVRTNRNGEITANEA